MSEWLEQGIRAFNDRNYFDAHEFWEDWWRESSGPTREFAQGLVQVAVGLHHLSQGNRRGGLSVLERGLHRLEAAPASYCGIDNSQLISDIRAYVARRWTSKPHRKEDSTHVPRVRLLSPPHHP